MPRVTPGLPVKHIVAAISDREKTGSTGFGGGIAIPHGKVAGLDRIYGLFVRLTEPLNYQAVDLMPVDLVFLLLSPPDAGADHLKALAQVSRALRDKQIRAKLRGARSNDAHLCGAGGGGSAGCRLTALARTRISGRWSRSIARRRSTTASHPRSRSSRPALARIRFEVEERHFHAAGAAHGTLYFKMMDDAAFYACNSRISDRFLLTTAFNLVFTRPLRAGPVMAEGRWVSGKRRVLIGEARLIDADGEEAARGTGTFMRSQHPAVGPRRLPRRIDAGRLPSFLVIVNGLLKIAEREGGFGTVLAKGDATAGSILIVLAERGQRKRLLERLLLPDGRYGWRDSPGAGQNEEDMVKFLDRRRRFDPDLWVLELDTASAERFAAEMTAH